MGKKYICIVVIILLLLLSHKNYALAQEIEREEEYIVFLMDHSGSMNSWDRQGVLHEIIKAFADTMYTGDCQIGYVAYNDRIVASHAPISVQTQEQIKGLKDSIDSASYGGETDIGLGLMEACSMLEGCQGMKTIVLISDGETDLENSDTGRTKEDSDRDLQEAVLTCKKEDIQITTIALGKEGANVKELEDIAQETGGENTSLKELDELFPVLCNLLVSSFEYSVYEVGDNFYDEGKQKIGYENSEYSDSLVVLLLSDKDIADANILYGTQQKNPQKIEFELTGKYAVATLNESEGDFSISFDTVQKQRIVTFVIGRREILPQLKWKETFYKNVPIDFQIIFMNKNGEPVKNLPYCAGWHGEFEDMQTGERTEVKITVDGQSLSGTALFPKSGNYALYLTPPGEERSACSITGIDVLNTLPSSSLSKEIKLLTISDKQAVNLDEYFADSDGDALKFELQEVPDQIVTAELQGNSLVLKPEKRGSGEIKLLISDGEGSLVGTIPVRTRSLMEAYWQAATAFLCIIAFVIFKLYRRKREIPVPERLEEKNECAFTGKLNAYFTLLPDGMEEVPPLVFALHPIRDKKIVLSDLFSDYSDLIDLLMLDNVFLFPAENRKMILYHDSDATIMIGNSIVCRKMQYIVGYGNVIYITSKDGTCELEVHYISMI